MSILPHPSSAVGTVIHAQEMNESAGDADDEIAATIAAVVHPPAYCPGCLAEAGRPFPAGATTCHCPRCLDRIRRVYQCARWNQDHAHQMAAGHASWDVFSARWRASCGLAPLAEDAARRYVTLKMIRGPLGVILPERLRAQIHRAWCVGQLLGVEAWLAEQDAPPHPDGVGASGDADPSVALSDALTEEEVADGGKR
jgi:hypothetical protein